MGTKEFSISGILSRFGGKKKNNKEGGAPLQ